VVDTIAAREPARHLDSTALFRRTRAEEVSLSVLEASILMEVVELLIASGLFAIPWYGLARDGGLLEGLVGFDISGCTRPPADHPAPILVSFFPNARMHIHDLDGCGDPAGTLGQGAIKDVFLSELSLFFLVGDFDQTAMGDPMAGFAERGMLVMARFACVAVMMIEMLAGSLLADPEDLAEPDELGSPNCSHLAGLLGIDGAISSSGLGGQLGDTFGVLGEHVPDLGSAGLAD
jgi:hypothetical protein